VQMVPKNTMKVEGKKRSVIRLVEAWKITTTCKTSTRISNIDASVLESMS